MPYDSIEDLPDRVRNPLPKKAQEIFLKTYNSAEDQYDKEEQAFRVAWNAVKKKYEKKDGKWVRKDNE